MTRGKLIEKFDTQTVSEKFKKREFVLEVSENPTYPQLVKFELKQDKVGLIDPFNVGETLEIEYNLTGRAWTNQQGVKSYFNTLECWRMIKVGGANTPSNDVQDMPF